MTAEEAARLQRGHAEAYARQVVQVRPLPGARELLAYLSQVPWARRAARRSQTLSPTTTDAAMSTPSRLAASRNKSGSGFA